MARSKSIKTKPIKDDPDFMSNFFNEDKFDLKKSPQFKINCKFKNKKQKELYDMILKNRITFVSGPAGTGKTFIALMAGLELVKDISKNINQVVLTKPIVEIKSQNGLGALPGDLTEKTLGYFTHFYDNLIKLVGNSSAQYLKDAKYIKETVLNFVRGSTFGSYDSNGKPVGSYCLFDEAQNTTIEEMKTFISRMGEETKLVILGDPDQIDLKFKANEKCGLVDAIERLDGIAGIAKFEFDEDDIVRDPLLIEIMKRYKKK